MPKRLPTVVVEAKPWWRSRTIVANVLTVVAFALGLILEQANVLSIQGAIAVWLGILLGLVNFILRMHTTAPIGQPGELVPVAGIAARPANGLSADEMLEIARLLRDLAQEQAAGRPPDPPVVPPRG